MPVPSRSKSIGSFASNDGSEKDVDGFTLESHSGSSSSSHLANLRSISRGKLLKPSLERQAKQANSEARNLNSNITMKQGVSHDSIELLSTRSTHPSGHRRQTLAAIPKRLMHIEEEDAANMDTSFNKGSLLLPGAGNPPLSPQIVGGLQYKTSASCRRPYKPRNSIDNADVSSHRPSGKLALEPMQEDGRSGQADRIRVYVRLRPMSSKEKETGARCCVRAANGREIYLTEMALESDYLRLKRLKGRYFVFDGAFPYDTGQEEVYHSSTAQLVEGVLEGRNSSVFCYGATGAGKTFTMLGTVRDPGVMVLALKDLFTKLKQRSRDGEHSVRLSYLEVYNETVRDLLSPGRALVLREDAKQGIVAAGLTQYKAFSADEVMALLQQGNQNRTTEPTRLNETSSRSHAILQVIVEYSTHVDSSLVTRVGKLSLIDLAGSERAIATDQRTLRSLEGANINRSLLALSSCISALVEGKKHIPFRNSKLTQLLKDSLGGACQTAMIANISPSNLSFGETQNTLYWADRAKEIRTKVCVANEELQVPGSGSEQLQLLLQVQKENQQLRMQVAQLQQKLLTLENNAMVSTPAAVHHEGSAVVVASPAATLLERPVQKENIEGTGTNAAIQEKLFLHCTEKKASGITCDSTHVPKQVGSSMDSHLDSLAPDLKQQVRCQDVLLRTPLTLSSIKRKILMRSPLPPPRDPSLGFHSTSRDNFCRKRTFWDITNTNSPYSKSTCRNTRSNTAAETPSMLLQPGFLRGRPSFN